jgi:predicted metal-dependent hydrolase
MPEIEIHNQTLSWRHEVKKNLKHSYIVIKPEGVVLRSPAISRAEAEDLLRSKGQWILKKLSQLQPPDARQATSLEEGSLVHLLGQPYTLQLGSHANQAGQPMMAVFLAEEKLVLQMPERLLAHVSLREEALHHFLRQEAMRFMNERLRYWSEALQLHPRRVKYKRHKRRWGSCTADNEINLNYRAIQLPPRCIDSILVHELAHIRHKNHGQSFWDLVYRFVPDYKALDQQIRDRAPYLL